MVSYRQIQLFQDQQIEIIENADEIIKLSEIRKAAEQNRAFM